jgi:hypothetical protein
MSGGARRLFNGTGTDAAELDEVRKTKPDNRRVSVMKNKAITAASAAFLSLSLLAGTPAMAQTQALDDAVTAQLVTLGFLPGDWVLTEEQMLEIQNVVSSNEPDGDKQEQIKRIVGDDVAAAPVVVRDMLDDAVTAQLVALGFLPDDWVLTEGQLVELQNVLSSTASEQSKQDQVRQIVEIN